MMRIGMFDSPFVRRVAITLSGCMGRLARWRPGYPAVEVRVARCEALAEFQATHVTWFAPTAY